MYIFLFSLFLYAERMYDAFLYQDDTTVQSHNNKNHRYWTMLANLFPQDERLYTDMSKESLEIQQYQAKALFLAQPNTDQLLSIYAQSTDPQVQASLLLAMSKHGDCRVLPYLHEALTRSHPLTLPKQTQSALYGIGILATRKKCDLTAEIDLITPMLHSFSIKRRKAAAFALSILQPQWKNPQVIWDATIREPNPRVRAWLIAAAQNTVPSEEIELQWFSDPDMNVRLEAIHAKPNSHILVELLKDQELWVQLETIRMLGKNGEELHRIIEAGASIDAEEKSIMTNSRRFAQSLVAIDVSTHDHDITASKYPTEIRKRAVSKITNRKKVKKLLKDKEPEIREQAARQYLKLSPENLDELVTLLENKHSEVVRVALEHVANTKEGAVEDSVWTILQQGSPDLIFPALHALSSFPPLKEKEEAISILTPFFTQQDTHILLSAHRLAQMMSISLPPFPWPENLGTKKHINIDTEYGRMQAELFIDDAPITSWQWITQIQEQKSIPTIINGDRRYLHLSLEKPMFYAKERHMHPIGPGSIVFSPDNNTQLWIAMEEHPEDLASHVVVGQIHQGIEILRQLRIQEQIKRISIAQSSTP